MELLMPGIGLLFWTLIAFLIVFFILKKYAWKPILTTLKNRETSITDAIASAEKVKAEMAQLKNENETIIAKAREERATILKEAKDIADKIVAQAKEQAKSDASKIIIDAQAAIQQQKMAALTDVKNQVGQLALEVAEKILRKQLSNKEAQEAYIKELAQDIHLN
jgi:F-type H+-transporting ATPase subunit b